MKFNEVIWTDKMEAVFADESPFIHLVGATGTSKTLIGSLLFFDRVYNAPANVNQFAIGGATGVLVKRNFVDKADSMHKIHSGFCTPYSDGNKEASGAHFCIKGKYGTKIVYLAGADNKNSFTNILSLDLGGILLDELSVLHIDLIRESYSRVQRLAYQGWLITTTNGGNPTQEFYTEFLNHATVQFRDTVPKIELDEMIENKVDEHYYHFNLRDDCPHKTEEQTARLISTFPVGSFYYYSKVLGCRGFQEGALYASFMHDGLLVPHNKINANALQEIICSVDMGTSKGQDDTKHAHTIATVTGFSKNYQRAIVLDAWVIPSNDFDLIIDEVDKRLLPYWANYYTKLTKIVIDYGDSGDMLIRSWRKRSRLKNVRVKGAVKAGKVNGFNKAINLQSRAQLKCQLISGGYLLWSTNAAASFQSHKKILSTKDGEELEQSNIDNDYADSLTYTLTENWIKVSNLLQGDKK